MSTEKTVPVSFRLRADVHQAIKEQAAATGIEPSRFMQDALEQSVIKYLSADRQEEIRNIRQLYAIAEERAHAIFAEGRFDETFILTVFRDLMNNSETRKLYEKVIGDDAYTDGVRKKTPLNMYLAWYIKNAIGADRLLDDAGKPRRTFVKNEPIQSYSLLTMKPAA